MSDQTVIEIEDDEEVIKEPLCLGCTVTEGPIYHWEEVSKWKWVMCGDCVDLFGITVEDVYVDEDDE